MNNSSSLNNQYQMAQQMANNSNSNSINNTANWQFIPSSSTTTTSGITLTSPYYSYGGISNTTYNINKSVYEKLQDLKTVEKLKKDYGIEDFHIVIDYHNLSPEYVFLTEDEMTYFRKYSMEIKEVVEPNEFNVMMNNNKSYIFVLGSTGEKYKDLEDLRKDYMILKLAGV